MQGTYFFSTLLCNRLSDGFKIAPFDPMFSDVHCAIEFSLKQPFIENINLTQVQAIISLLDNRNEDSQETDIFCVKCQSNMAR